MKLTTKLFSLLITVLTLVSAMAVMPANAATFSDVPEDSQYYQAIEKLHGIGVIDGFEDGTFKPADGVTRAQMSKLIARLFNYPASVVSSMPFTDVPVDHWAAGDIVSAKNAGIVNGMGDGTFEPDANVTYHQAVKMVVCALNYGAAAEALGGWSNNGYIQQALKINLTRGAMMGNDENAPRGIIAQLLFNASDITMPEPVLNADGTTSWVVPTDGTGKKAGGPDGNSETIKNALVIAVPEIAIGGYSQYCQTGDIYILVNNVPTLFKVSASAYQYIGMLTEVTYTTDTQSGVKTITYIKPVNGTEYSTILSASKIKEITASGITYYTDIDNTKTSTYQFEGSVNIIYNERYANLNDGIAAINADVKNDTAVGALNIGGTVKVSRTSSNTVVTAKIYKSYYVSTAVITTSNQENVTVDKPGGTTEKISVPIDKAGSTTVIKRGLFASAATATLGSIAKNSVVSISRSIGGNNANYVEIIAGPTAATGTITATDTNNEGEKIVTIGNNKYSVSDGLNRHYTNEYDKISADANGTFYLDTFGYIVWTGTVSSGTYKAGLLVYVTNTGSSLNKTTNATFRDTETNTNFTVIIDDNATDTYQDGATTKRTALGTLKYESNNETKFDRMFWMKISSGNKIKRGDIEEAVPGSPAGRDGLTVTCEYYDNAFELTGGYYKFYPNSNDYSGTAVSKSITSPTVFIRPLTTDSTRNITTGNITVDAKKYYGTAYYTIKKSGSTDSQRSCLVVNTLQTLLATSKVYIVKAVGGQIQEGDYQVKKYNVLNFKDGGEETINVLLSEVDKIGLQIGDVFTYYKTSTLTNVEIDNFKTVTMLFNAKKAIADNNGVKTDGGTNFADVNNHDVSFSKNGYDFFNIDNTTVVEKTITSNGSHYTLALPIAFNQNNELHLGLQRNDTNGQVSIVLPKNISTNKPNYPADIDVSSSQSFINALSNSEFKNISSAKCFIYNDNEADASKVTIGDSSAANGIITLHDIKGDITKSDLVFARFTSTNFVYTISSIYIIRR